MSLLSITFHTEASKIQQWQEYINDELVLLTENLMDVERYVLSVVETEMITEGQNTNLLLFFDNEGVRGEFITNEFKNISERIEAKFGESVMIFKTELNPVKSRI